MKRLPNIAVFPPFGRVKSAFFQLFPPFPGYFREKQGRKGKAYYSCFSPLWEGRLQLFLSSSFTLRDPLRGPGKMGEKEGRCHLLKEGDPCFFSAFPLWRLVISGNQTRGEKC